MGKSSSKRIFILIEDHYGPKFLLNLINRLKNEEGLKVSLSEKDIKTLPGKFNPKVRRKIEARARLLLLDRIIIIADAEGGSVEETKSRLEEHVPEDLRSKTCYIIFKWNKEEWLCEGLGLAYGAENPEKLLNKYFRETKGAKLGYHKSYQPYLVDQLNLERLKKNKLFQEFVKLLE